ncbi:hypothetical protein NL676_031531 [Syzygium grande]|nr:hypothetical protein NL676_031531 [Syzygium grande]
MTPTDFMSASAWMKLMSNFLSNCASLPTLVTRLGPISFPTELGHHSPTLLLSFVKRNLLLAGPHRTTIRSQNSEVLKTEDLCLFIRAQMNRSGLPSRLAWEELEGLAKDRPSEAPQGEVGIGGFGFEFGMDEEDKSEEEEEEEES